MGRGHSDVEGPGREDIDDLLAEIQASMDPAEVDDPGPTEPSEDPVSRRGDLWILGEHRLLCGDSASSADLALLMGALVRESLSLTDPVAASRPIFSVDRPR